MSDPTYQAASVVTSVAVHCLLSVDLDTPTPDSKKMIDVATSLLNTISHPSRAAFLLEEAIDPGLDNGGELTFALKILAASAPA